MSIVQWRLHIFFKNCIRSFLFLIIFKLFLLLFLPLNQNLVNLVFVTMCMYICWNFTGNTFKILTNINVHVLVLTNGFISFVKYTSFKNRAGFIFCLSANPLYIYMKLCKDVFFDSAGDCLNAGLLLRQ